MYECISGIVEVVKVVAEVGLVCPGPGRIRLAPTGIESMIVGIWLIGLRWAAVGFGFNFFSLLLFPLLFGHHDV